MQDFLRTLITVVSLATFIGIVVWALSARRKKDFDEAAHLPLNEPDDRPSKGAARQAQDKSDDASR